MDVKRDAGVIGMYQPAPLACRLVAPPNLTACRFPFLACIKRLALGGNSTEPSRVEFAQSVPHRVIRARQSPMLDVSGL